MTSRSIPVIFTLYEVIRIVIFEFLLKWKRIEFTTKSKLAIDLFLADVKILDIEES